ncbi:isoprenylcysteine carboxylmethyltransferase family protein [Aureimonas sp. SK2]|uniref:methyltransferase family protein n=1 Tax=Aureimonas sp. SK2 TaxID=3015992 RepID=UPI0024447E71|nr:methyltransferase [Aureimonas sp. SK2]
MTDTPAEMRFRVSGISRNPMYVRMVLSYLGVAVAIGSPAALALLPVVVALPHFGVLVREERYLATKFGTEYLNYQRKVLGWI